MRGRDAAICKSRDPRRESAISFFLFFFLPSFLSSRRTLGLDSIGESRVVTRALARVRLYARFVRLRRACASDRDAGRCEGNNFLLRKSRAILPFARRVALTLRRSRFTVPACNAGGIKSAGCGRNTATVPYFAAGEKPQRQSRARDASPAFVQRASPNSPPRTTGANLSRCLSSTEGFVRGFCECRDQRGAVNVRT